MKFLGMSKVKVYTNIIIYLQGFLQNLQEHESTYPDLMPLIFLLTFFVLLHKEWPK